MPDLCDSGRLSSWVDAQLSKVDPLGAGGGGQGPVRLTLQQDDERGVGDELSGGAQLGARIGFGREGASDDPQCGHVCGAMPGVVDQ